MTSIISVNFNQPAVTIDFLRSVLANTHSGEVEMILVDNGSKEDHGDDFKAIYPGLVYIRSDKNLGFAGGNNLGISQAKSEFLLLLNNDTEISNNLIAELTEVLITRTDVGLVSPLILYFQDPDIIQYAGFTPMNYVTARNHGIGYFEKNRAQYDNDSRETAYCHGAAVMCRKADMDKGLLMDESYFLYYEELDWCEKFKRAGMKIWFTGKTHILHKESMTVGKESIIKTYFMTRNRILFIRRNAGLVNSLLFFIYYLILAGPKQLLQYIRKGRLDLVKWQLKGIGWNFTHSKRSTDLGFKI
jgi:GT2 family glycosyltransferase